MPTNRHSKMPRPKDTLDPAQTSEILGLGRSTLARHARQGKIQVIKVGVLNRYVASDVARLIRQNNTQNAAERLLGVLDKMVEDNNAAIAKEAQRAGRKD